MEEVSKLAEQAGKAEGDVFIELQEIQKFQSYSVDGIETITVGCSGLFTLICC